LRKGFEIFQIIVEKSTHCQCIFSWLMVRAPESKET
jgi:hypothetical protein